MGANKLENVSILSTHGICFNITILLYLVKGFRLKSKLIKKYLHLKIIMSVTILVYDFMIILKQQMSTWPKGLEAPHVSIHCAHNLYEDINIE